MGRVGAFLFGVIVGGVLVFGSLNYHLLRTGEGFYLVPKQRAHFSEAYVDVRAFTAADWAERPGLSAAVVQAGKGHIMQAAAGQTLREGLDRAIEGLGGGH